MTKTRKAAVFYTHTHTDKPCWLNFFQFILIPICIFVPLTVFAVDINEGDSATCDTNVLNTDTGPVNLRAEYEAENINLKWYNDGARVTVPTASNSCTYDTAISLPPNPTKPGYKFKGWKIVQDYDFSTLTFSGAAAGYSKGAYSSTNTFHEDYNCMYVSSASNRQYRSCSDSNLTDLNVQEWKVINNGNTVYGNAKCSGKSGNNNNDTWNNASSNWLATYNELENVTGDKRYCWCHLTGYKPSNENTIYIPSNSLSWIYAQNIEVAACGSACTMWCAAKFISYSGLQNALLGK